MAKYDSTKVRNFADPSHRGMAGGGQCGGHVRADVGAGDVGEGIIRLGQWQAGLRKVIFGRWRPGEEVQGAGAPAGPRQFPQSGSIWIPPASSKILKNVK